MNPTRLISNCIIIYTLWIAASCGAREPGQTDTGNGPVHSADRPLESPDIQFRLNGYSGGQATLVGMFTDQQYMLDTARIDGQGRVRFNRQEPYQPGLAFLLLPDQSFFQLLISDDQTFTMETAKGNFVQAMKVEGSTDNELLYRNLAFEAGWQPRVNEVNARLRETLPVHPDYAGLESRRDALVAERKEHLDEIFREHPGSFFTEFKKAGQNPDIKDVRKPDGNIDSTRQLYMYRTRFWDDVNFANEWLLYTPVISNKLKRYINELTPQVADSINKSASALADRVLAYPEYYKYFVNWITMQYEPGKTTLMDGEAVYVHMVGNYFTYDRAFWSDSLQIYAIRKKASEMQLSLTGQKAQDVTARDLSGTMRSLYDIKSPYLIVYLYNPTCDHCIEETPKLVQFHRQWKARGLEVYAIALDTDDAAWRDFVNRNGMQGWTNVFDPTNKSIYGKYYVDNTPEIYLLDPDRTIIAKNLKTSQVAQMIERDIKRRAR